MTRRLVVLAALLMVLLCPLAAHGETLMEGLQKAIGGVDLKGFQDAVDSLGGAVDIEQSILSIASGETVISLDALMQSLFKRFMAGLYQSVFRVTRLMAPAIICGLVSAFGFGGKSDTAREITAYACFLLVAVIMVQDLKEHIDLSQDAIHRMTSAMQSLFPILLTLLAAIGGTASAAFFQPAVVAASGFMTSLIQNTTLPFTISTAVLVMLDHVSDTVRVSRLASLSRQIATWTLGVSFTVFIGVTLIQGIGTAAVDGISIRTAKYTIDNFVPIVGGMFADTVDTLVGCSLLIKNALGVTGLIVLVSLCSGPMIQTLLSVFVYRLCAALLQPAAESRIVKCMQDFSDVLMLLFIIQLSVSAMFILLIAQMLVVGNLTVMLR